MHKHIVTTPQRAFGARPPCYRASHTHTHTHIPHKKFQQQQLALSHYGALTLQPCRKWTCRKRLQCI